MKRILDLLIAILISSVASGQILKTIPAKEDTKLDICFGILEESNYKFSVNQVASLIDSLESEEKKKFLKEEVSINSGKGDKIYSIGDRAQGGIIFWVDKSGQHGLVASEEDLASEVTFYEGKTSALKGDSIYAGKYNTKQIISNKSVEYYAAIICSDFQGGGYSDWYLPSKFELNILYSQYTKRNFNNFARDFYWSSSEDVNDVAWLVRFYEGQVHNYKKYGSTSFRVRAIRAF